MSLLLFAIGWEITFHGLMLFDTLQAKLSHWRQKTPKPDRGCKFRASIEHKLTRGLSQKTVCVYAICSPLSGLSSQFCYNITKCSRMRENKFVNVSWFSGNISGLKERPEICWVKTSRFLRAFQLFAWKTWPEQKHTLSNVLSRDVMIDNMIMIALR